MSQGNIEVGGWGTLKNLGIRETSHPRTKKMLNEIDRYIVSY